MKKLEKEKGPFTLFALFMQEGSLGPWDLVVSAPWLEKGRVKALGELINKLTREFGKEELRSFSIIVPLNHDSPTLHRILDEVGTIRRPMERVGRDLFGLPVYEAHILKARRPRLAA